MSHEGRYPYNPHAYRKFTILDAPHAALLKREKPGYKGSFTVGDHAGKYGREDSATGAEYRAIGQNAVIRGRSVVQHSPDLECAYFYPNAVFIIGYKEEEDDPVPFEEIEAFQRKLWPSTAQRVILPYGWDQARGGWTWLHGVYFLAQPSAGIRPSWWQLHQDLHSKFPEGRIERAGKGQLSVSIVFGEHEVFPSTNPKLGEFVKEDFLTSEECEKHVKPEDREHVHAVYEHGQWWIQVGVTGASWSVVDCGRSETDHYFGFEQVARGDDE